MTGDNTTGSLTHALLGRGCFPFASGTLSDNPDLIIHNSFIRDVDFCEDKSHADRVIEVNLKWTTDLLTRAGNIPVIVISSDHVFSGKNGNYTEKDTPNPVNFYGMSMLTVEAACKSFDNAYVVRTSNLFSKDTFYWDYEKKLIDNQKISVSTVLYRTFEHMEHFVEGLLVYSGMIYRKENCPKLLNISGTENISWHELVLCMADMCKYNHKLIHPITHKDDSFVPRPLNAGLNTSKARQLGIPLFSFHDGLRMIYG